MKINPKKAIETFNRLNNKNQTKEFLNNKFTNNSFFIVPFELQLGIVNSTETGFVSENTTLNSFTSFAKVLTGLDNLVAKWENAYTTFIDEEAIKDLPREEKYITKEYKVGRLIKAISFENSFGNSVIPSPIDNTFNQIEITETIKIQVEEKLTNKDIFKVFIIPEKNKWQWLYIVDNGITEYFDKDNNYLYSDVQLMSVNSLYATSGGAIEQFIQKSAPGEGYAFPKWIEESKKIELDEIRAKDIPIQSIQREYSGAAIFNTLFCYGRPTIQIKNEETGIIENIFNPKIKVSRLLLPYKMETPIISPINTKPTAETDYYISKETAPTAQKYYKNWQEQFTNNFDLNVRKQFTGVLEFENEAKLESTNPIDRGSHQYILWDTNFVINFNNETFDTRTNKLTGAEIILNGVKTIPEILSHNSFITNHLTTMPMNAETNTTWKLQDTALIGGFLNTLTLGIPIGWTNENVRVQMGKIMTIVPANVIKYGNELPGIDKLKNSVVSFDLVKENNDTIENSGIAGMGSSIKVGLTDQFTKNGIIYNTIQLGQKQDDGTILKWDGNCSPVAPDINTPGYVIDKSIDKTISKTNVRTIFYSYGFEAFQTTYKTKSKFTGEIRDWTNEINFSEWKTDTGVISWPEIIQQPQPPDTKPTIIEIPLTTPTTYSQVDGTNEAIYGKKLFLDAKINNRAGTSFFSGGKERLFNERLRDYKSEITDYNFSEQAPNLLQLQNKYEFIDFQFRGNYFRIPLTQVDKQPINLNYYKSGTAFFNMTLFPDRGSTQEIKKIVRNIEYYEDYFLVIESFNITNIKFSILYTNRVYEYAPGTIIETSNYNRLTFDNYNPATQSNLNNNLIEQLVFAKFPSFKVLEDKDPFKNGFYLIPK